MRLDEQPVFRSVRCASAPDAGSVANVQATGEFRVAIAFAGRGVRFALGTSGQRQTESDSALGWSNGS